MNQSALPGLAGIGPMAGRAACGLGLAACGLGETDGPGAEAVSGEDTETVGWGEDAAGA